MGRSLGETAGIGVFLFAQHRGGLARLLHFAMAQDGNEEIKGFGGLEAKTLAEWILEDAPWARLQLQVHKYIWPAFMRGV